MLLKNPLIVDGARVRLSEQERRLLPEAAKANGTGHVTRVDARGVLVRLASGHQVLLEPSAIFAVLVD